MLFVLVLDENPPDDTDFRPAPWMAISDEQNAWPLLAACFLATYSPSSSQTLFGAKRLNRLEQFLPVTERKA